MMTDNRSNVLDLVAKVWAEQSDHTLAQVSRLEDLVVALMEERLTADMQQEGEQIAHKLAGSLGTFGFPDASRLGGKIQQIFASQGTISEEEALSLSDMVVALRDALGATPARTGVLTAPETSSSYDRRLLVVDQDPEFAGRLKVEAAAQGMAAEVASDLDLARESIGRHAPHAVLLDLSISTHGEADAGEGSLAFLEELANWTPPVPVVVRTGKDSFGDRVEVARRGGRGFLPKSLSPRQSIGVVSQLMHCLCANQPRVLAVDDDTRILATLEALLKAHGLHVDTLDAPLKFWDALTEIQPDLLVLDLDMPQVSGIEVCRVLRNDPNWSGLPVLCLTAYNDPDTIERVFASGADDYVSKPIVGSELITRITNRLERAQLNLRMKEYDPLTGILNRSKANRELDQLITLAERNQQTLALGLINIDQFKKANDQLGTEASDEVLRQLAHLLTREFHESDVVARWGGDEFLVSVFGISKDDCIHQLADVMERLRQAQLPEVHGADYIPSFSAGVSEYPTDGDDLSSLSLAADEALRQAKLAGGARAFPAGWQPGVPQNPLVVDVVLVDDDETLANLLLHALATRGYHTRWIQDGKEALQQLAGENPRLKAKVVLLDIGLPGLDGFGALRQLARDNITNNTRVIMLTFRAAETEMLSALGTGAFDYVAKPFSLSLLMQRIRIAMEG